MATGVWAATAESVPLDLVKIFAPGMNRHLRECSKNNTDQVVRDHLLLVMKGANTLSTYSIKTDTLLAFGIKETQNGC